MNPLKHSICFCVMLTIALLGFAPVSQAQTVDEIIKKYFENTGGEAKWKALKSIKVSGKIKQGAMDIPFTQIQTASGKQKMVYTFQGKELVSPSFDGKEGWTTNFMTMKAEKMEAEDSENMRREMGDFPDPFIDYAKKGYKVTLLGEETVEGAACFKIQLTRKPELVDGKEVENSDTYFFDKENYVPIVQRSVVNKGQGKGMVIETVFSDYQEVNGLMLPFSITQKANGETGGGLVFEKYEFDVAVNDADFSFPETK
jgi:outer membrane lipoprotein-sorting protein